MQPRRRSSLLSFAAVLAIATVLGVLAVLQYRWIGRVSDAERQRMQAGLETAVDQFRVEMNRELIRICAAAQADPRAVQEAGWDSFARSCSDGIRQLSYPSLVAEIYVWDARADGGTGFFRVNLETEQLEGTSWPAGLESLRDFPSRPFPAPWRRTPMEMRLPSAWQMHYGLPALVHPLPMATRRPARGRPDSPFAGLVIVSLNADFLRNEFWPDLAYRYFAGPEGSAYRVAILDRSSPPQVLYRSEEGLSAADFEFSEAAMPLLWEPRDYLARFSADGRLRRMFEPALTIPPGDRSMDPFRTPRAVRGMAAAVLLSVGDRDGWELRVQYRGGSLDAVVAGVRRRNLAISFGILLLLAASMAMVIVYTQRARRLARLQMNFVAGVSHELRTPLAVICSAGENLADGVVTASSERVREYGRLVREEGRRLTEMVEQILQFAGHQAGGPKFRLRPTDVRDVIRSTLAALNTVIGSAQFTVEQTVTPDLPRIETDPEALGRCLSNLLVNALRYGGSSRWLEVRAETAADGPRGAEVRITVEDRGPGIDPDELPRIFDPFFRGRAGLETHTHGSGLGLSMTREIMNSMGGRITVRSSPGKGSSFTLHVPLAEQERGTRK